MTKIDITLPGQDAQMSLKLTDRARALFSEEDLADCRARLSPSTLTVGDELQFSRIHNCPTLVVLKRSWVLKPEKHELTIWLDVFED